MRLKSSRSSRKVSTKLINSRKILVVQSQLIAGVIWNRMYRLLHRPPEVYLESDATGHASQREQDSQTGKPSNAHAASFEERVESSPFPHAIALLREATA